MFQTKLFLIQIDADPEGAVRFGCCGGYTANRVFAGFKGSWFAWLQPDCRVQLKESEEHESTIVTSLYEEKSLLNCVFCF